jgi:hypothetical protein
MRDILQRLRCGTGFDIVPELAAGRVCVRFHYIFVGVFVAAKQVAKEFGD